MSAETTISDRIDAVSSAEADGEQLVSVAIPPGDSLAETRETLEEDAAEAEYLDVREEVRKPLKRAIEEAKRILHDYDETPENGLAVYTGVIEGDLVTYVFDDLPDPVATATYGYANEFDATPLEPNTPDTDTYGLLVVTREEAALGRYDGDIETVETVESDVPSKQAAEGRKEDRFQGRSEQRREEFFDTVGEAAERTFLDTTDEGGREPTVEGLVLGGSEVIVEGFENGDHLPDALDDVLLGTFDVEYAAEPGLRELVDAAEDAVFEETDARSELERFFAALDADDELAVGGREAVDEALTYDAVETLLLVESVSPDEAQALEERAEESGAAVVVVPVDLDRAEQLREAYDGVGALLRFPVE